MLISTEYLRLQRELHLNPNYGVASLAFAPMVAHVVRKFDVRNLSDYGAGKQNLRKGLETQGIQLDYYPYDPAFPEYGEARSADLVCCIDVLEHIEPECLDAVLDELQHLTVARGLFTIHTGPAVKHLSDGRNAHLIQEPPEWWLPKLRSRFHVESFQVTAGGFVVLVQPLPF